MDDLVYAHQGYDRRRIAEWSDSGLRQRRSHTAILVQVRLLERDGDTLRIQAWDLTRSREVILSDRSSRVLPGSWLLIRGYESAREDTPSSPVFVGVRLERVFPGWWYDDVEIACRRETARRHFEQTGAVDPVLFLPRSTHDSARYRLRSKLLLLTALASALPIVVLAAQTTW